MCRRVNCRQCGKPSWAGCGAHVEQVLGDVPKADRCQCATSGGSAAKKKGFLSSIFGGKTTSVLVAVATVVLGGVLASCGGDDTSSEAASVDSVQSPAVGEVVIIDVRTPAEFAEGHLEGAVNHNVEDGTLAAALAGLDPAGEYVVYCRSGRRSAIAVAQMADAGFANVTDLGSVEEAASATGLAVVTG